jgi:hypothetical protein
LKKKGRKRIGKGVIRKRSGGIKGNEVYRAE